MPLHETILASRDFLVSLLNQPTDRTARLKPQRQVHLQYFVALNRIYLGKVLIAAARADGVIDSMSEAVTDSSNHIVCDAVSACHVKTLEVAAAFEEIRVNQVDIQRIFSMCCQ